MSVVLKKVGRSSSPQVGRHRRRKTEKTEGDGEERRAGGQVGKGGQGGPTALTAEWGGVGLGSAGGGWEAGGGSPASEPLDFLQYLDIRRVLEPVGSF